MEHILGFMVQVGTQLFQKAIWLPLIIFHAVGRGEGTGTEVILGGRWEAMVGNTFEHEGASICNRQITFKAP